MNCDSIHRRLLSLERPEQPPADVRGHLAACPACQGWHRRLLQVEQAPAGLPVPPPRQKTAFLERLRKGTELAPDILRFNPSRPRPQLDTRERGRQKTAVAVALAAALLLVTLAVWLWKGSETPHPAIAKGPTLSPLADRLDKSAAWANARTPRERLGVLSDLADEVHGKAEKIAHGELLKDVDKDVNLYREIIDRTTAEAKQLPRAQRLEVLKPLADRLARAESEANRLAELSLKERPAAAAPLRQLAALSRQGDRQIRALIREATA